MSETAQNIDNQEQNISTLATAEQDLIKSIASLATPEMDTAKAEVLPDLAKQVVKLFPDFQKIPSAADLNKIIPSTGRTVLQELFFQLPKEHTIQFNLWLNPNHPQHQDKKGKMTSFMDTQIKEFTDLAALKARIAKKKIENNDKRKTNEGKRIESNELDKTGEELDIESNEFDKTEEAYDIEIAKLKAELAATTKQKGDLDTKFDIKPLTTTEQEALAKEKFGKTTEQLAEEIKTGKYGKITNPDGTKFGVSDFLAFINTEEALANNPDAAKDPQFAEYRKSFSAMKKDLPRESISDVPPSLPAEKIGNISTAQIQNPDNEQFASYVKYDSIDKDKTDYKDSELTGKLQNTLYAETKNIDDDALALVNHDSPLSLEDNETLHSTADIINEHRHDFKQDVAKSGLVDFDLPDDFTSLEAEQKQTLRNAIVQTEKKDHSPELTKMSNALKTRLDIHKKYGQKLAPTDRESETDQESGSVKLAKFMSNEVRTQSTQVFLSTIADSMSSRIGDTNTGDQARIQTDTMKLSKDGEYSCDFHYGDSPQTYSLSIGKDGKVQMTDLLANTNPEVFQTALTDINITVPGMESIETTATDIAKANFSDLLSPDFAASPARSGGAFSTFQKEFSDTLRTKLTEQVSTDFVDSKSLVQKEIESYKKRVSEEIR